MTSPPHDDSRTTTRVLRPARHHHGGPAGHGLPAGNPAVLTFWPDSPYQGFRRGYRCPSAALTAPGRRSVHGRCATDVRRGTDLLAGRRRARRAKAGGRTLSGKRAGGGLRTGRAPGAGEATPPHAPARPPVTGRRGAASTRPAGTAPHPRAESADTRLTARPAARVRPPARRPGPPVPLAIFRLPRVRSGVQGGLWHVRGPERFTRGKAILGMTSLVSQRSVRQPCRTITRQVTRQLWTADRPAAPGRAVTPGQPRNIPAGVNRG